MTRRSAIMAALMWGVAKADQFRVTIVKVRGEADAFHFKYNGREATVSMSEVMDALERRPPANNQCPVCGTMAPPFYARPRPMCGDSVVFEPETGKTYSLCDPRYLPTENLVTCKQCRATFWQVAEPTPGSEVAKP